MTDEHDNHEHDRRREARVDLEIPVRVQGYWADGTSWEELTAIDNASSLGVSLVLEHSVEVGQVLHLVMPFPTTIRQFDFVDPKYRIYGLVRHTEDENQDRRLGVQFLSKTPPRGYERKPWTRYALPEGASQEGEEEAAPPPRATEAPPEEETPADPRRRHGRFDVFVGFTIQPEGGDEDEPVSELAVSENVGHGGARFRTSLDLGLGSIVTVRETESGFEARAEVRNTFVGPDGVRRINVMFLDGKSPVRLVGKK
jgi:hypothetical protein